MSPSSAKSKRLTLSKKDKKKAAIAKEAAELRATTVTTKARAETLLKESKFRASRPIVIGGEKAVTRKRKRKVLRSVVKSFGNTGHNSDHNTGHKTSHNTGGNTSGKSFHNTGKSSGKSYHN